MNKIPKIKSTEHIAYLAGAGTGKTTFIVNDIVTSIRNDLVSADQVLVLTFSRRAVNDLRKRLKSSSSRTGGIVVRTFHALAAEVVRDNYGLVDLRPNFTILHEPDAKAVLRGVIDAKASLSDVGTTTEVWAAIERYKAEVALPNDIGVSNASEKALVRIYKQLQAELIANNCLSFSDLILFAIKIFRENPNILRKHAKQYKMIYVDEFQDTNLAQYELLNLISSMATKILVVGDDDQSIYGWRNVPPRMMERFKRDRNIPKFKELTKNYRSSTSIIHAANALISFNKNRVDKRLEPTKTDGTLVKVMRLEKQEEEAKWIADKINELLGKIGNDSKIIAILCRHRAYFKKIETQLRRSEIAFQVANNPFESKSIRLLLAYLQAIKNCDNNIAMKKIINTPKRGISRTIIEKIERVARRDKKSFWEAALTLNQEEKSKKLAMFIKQFSKLKKFLETHTAIEVTEKIAIDIKMSEYPKEKNTNISELHKLTSLMKPKQSVQDFLDDTLEEHSSSKISDGVNVSLLTIHTAKGLEFDYVFLPAWEEHRFPGKSADVEEERRVAFVGITRAKEMVFISSVMTNRDGIKNKSSDVKPSRFITELNSDYVEKRRSKQASKWLEYNRKYVKPSHEIDIGDIVSYNAYGKDKNYGYGKVIGLLGKEIEVEFNGYDIGVVKKSDVTKAIKPSKAV